MRASEVPSLEREQVDLKRKVAILPDTKNGDRRIVPLPDEFESAKGKEKVA